VDRAHGAVHVGVGGTPVGDRDAHAALTVPRDAPEPGLTALDDPGDHLVGAGVVIACGVQAVDPHNEGSGALKANEPIVMDVFPQHAQTRYFADITRTVAIGEPTQEMRERFTAQWLETPIPALNDLSPRQAVTTPEGRAKVIQLMKHMEYLEDGRRGSGEPVVMDVAHIRRELGLR